MLICSIGCLMMMMMMMIGCLSVSDTSLQRCQFLQVWGFFSLWGFTSFGIFSLRGCIACGDLFPGCHLMMSHLMSHAP